MARTVFVKSWSIEKGWGFIALEGGGADIFLHATALKEASPRLKVGDTVLYAEEPDERKDKKRSSECVLCPADSRAKVGVKKPRTEATSKFVWHRAQVVYHVGAPYVCKRCRLSATLSCAWRAIVPLSADT